MSRWLLSLSAGSLIALFLMVSGTTVPGSLIVRLISGISSAAGAFLCRGIDAYVFDRYFVLNYSLVFNAVFYSMVFYGAFQLVAKVVTTHTGA